MKKMLTLALALLIGLALAACQSAHQSEVNAQNAALGASPLYLNCNVHAVLHRNDITASYANWTNPPQGHTLIPINALVVVQPWRNGFILSSDGRTVYFEVDERNAKMTGAAYAKMITQASPVRLESFSEIDRQGVAKGKALPGMTKPGVIAALGYPAKHRTPSTDSNEWIYWQTRFTTIVVEFDEQGKVKNIRR
jgi:hypothetical protein